jgi:hypothetical protein
MDRGPGPRLWADQRRQWQINRCIKGNCKRRGKMWRNERRWVTENEQWIEVKHSKFIGMN